MGVSSTGIPATSTRNAPASYSITQNGGAQLITIELTVLEGDTQLSVVKRHPDAWAGTPREHQETSCGSPPLPPREV